MERFWSKVNKTEACWLWMGFVRPDGYGSFRMSDGNPGAHRVAYELLIGPIPDGLQLDHLCRVRHCVNPAHLEPVTCRENLMRGSTWAAQNARKTHCKNGHPFDEANTGLTKHGHRRCRACTLRRLLEWKARQ